MLRKFTKNKRGYVSIETVIVAGLVIALGAFALTEFYGTAQQITRVSTHNMKKPFNVVHTTPSGPIEEVEL